MIQRIIGLAVGALITWAILWWNHVDTTLAAMAVVVGAIAAFLWPVVIGFFLARRVKQRRQDSIEEEVARQVAAQTRDQ